jgi:hypothetical protein
MYVPSLMCIYIYIYMHTKYVNTHNQTHECILSITISMHNSLVMITMQFYNVRTCYNKRVYVCWLYMVQLLCTYIYRIIHIQHYRRSNTFVTFGLIDLRTACINGELANKYKYFVTINKKKKKKNRKKIIASRF